MSAVTVQLEREWTVEGLVGEGGFGHVLAASSPDFGGGAVAKFVPKAPGAERELLALTRFGGQVSA